MTMPKDDMIFIVEYFYTESPQLHRAGRLSIWILNDRDYCNKHMPCVAASIKDFWQYRLLDDSRDERA